MKVVTDARAFLIALAVCAAGVLIGALAVDVPPTSSRAVR